MFDLIVTYLAFVGALLGNGPLGALFALIVVGFPLVALGALTAYAVDYLRGHSQTADCRCLTAHPDDPTPCASCCTRWERLRFTVENFVLIRVLRKNTCICGEH